MQGWVSDAVRDPVIHAANDVSDDESDGAFVSAWAQLAHEADNEMTGDPQDSNTEALADAGSGLKRSNDGCKAVGLSDTSPGNLAARGTLGDDDGAGGLIHSTDADDGEGHPDDAVEDLAVRWRNLGDDEPTAAECNNAEGTLAEVWCGAGAKLDGSDPENLPGLIDPINAEDSQGHPVDAVEDLALRWGNLGHYDTNAPECNTAEGDLADIWCRAGAELHDADPEHLPEAGLTHHHDAREGTGHSDNSVEDLATKWGSVGDDL